MSKYHNGNLSETDLISVSCGEPDHPALSASFTQIRIQTSLPAQRHVTHIRVPPNTLCLLSPAVSLPVLFVFCFSAGACRAGVSRDAAGA